MEHRLQSQQQQRRLSHENVACISGLLSLFKSVQTTCSSPSLAFKDRVAHVCCHCQFQNICVLSTSTAYSHCGKKKKPGSLSRILRILTLNCIVLYQLRWHPTFSYSSVDLWNKLCNTLSVVQSCHFTGTGFTWCFKCWCWFYFLLQKLMYLLSAWSYSEDSSVTLLVWTAGTEELLTELLSPDFVRFPSCLNWCQWFKQC